MKGHASHPKSHSAASRPASGEPVACAPTDGVKCFKRNLGKLLLRLSLSMLTLHGVQKFMDLGGTAKFFGMLGIPAPETVAFLVAAIETFGGLAFLLGLGTRCAAALVAIVMVGAITTAHLGQAFEAGLPFGLLKFELAWVYLLGALSLVFLGAGKWSLDRCLGLDGCKSCKMPMKN